MLGTGGYTEIGVAQLQHQLQRRRYERRPLTAVVNHLCLEFMFQVKLMATQQMAHPDCQRVEREPFIAFRDASWRPKGIREGGAMFLAVVVGREDE